MRGLGSRRRSGTNSWRRLRPWCRRRPRCGSRRRCNCSGSGGRCSRGRRWSSCYCCGGSRRCSRCGSRCRCRRWTRSRRGRRCACRALHLKGAFIDPTIHDAIKPWPALIEERRRTKLRITCINSRTAGQQGMGECWATIILQRTEQWSSIDLIARAGQETTSIVTAQVIAVRRDRGQLSNVKVDSR